MKQVKIKKTAKSMTNNYDIFISYRRDNGEDKVRILNQFFSTVGYRVFFDHKSGMTGEFETEILAAVEIAPAFLMLLTPHCLDRCIDENDWVRREIERATKFGKDIIPIRPNYDESIFKILPEGREARSLTQLKRQANWFPERQHKRNSLYLHLSTEESIR